RTPSLMSALSVSSMGPPMRKNRVSVPWSASERARMSEPVSVAMAISFRREDCDPAKSYRNRNGRSRDLCVSASAITGNGASATIPSVVRRRVSVHARPRRFDMHEEPTAYRVPDPGVRALFTEPSRYQAWLDVEAALALAQAELGVIPEHSAREIAAKAHL